jgi:serine/threonine-protein kinase
VLALPEDDTRRDEARERFLREGRATAALVSDHVVRVYDVGTLDTGAPFIVMELLRGRDLAVTLQQNGALPIEHAADCVRQAADAIACAHAQGIVHRDLKPSNLFLTQRSDGMPLIKVLDFGISKTTQGALEPLTSNLTAARSVLGTPFYMSPEQIRDAKQVDFRTDIWSLGLILHELLTGAPAFEGTTLPGVCAAIAADAPAALRLKRPEVPVELEAIVLRCLEKDPEKRFQDVRDLAAKLAPFSGRPDSNLLLPLSDKTIRSSPLTFGISELQHNPTVSLVAEGDPGTMPSARLAPAGDRLLGAGAALGAKEQQTLSAAPTTVPAPARTDRGGRPSAERRSLWLVAGGLVALCVVGAWALHGSLSVEPAPASSVFADARSASSPLPAGPAATPAPALASFALEISANTPGAQVYEGAFLLGSTPLRLSIDSTSVARAPRTFTVSKTGYLPYTIVQGPAQRDAQVLAELSAAPGASVAASSSSRPKKPPGPKVAPGKHQLASPPPDIFMQR